MLIIVLLSLVYIYIIPIVGYFLATLLVMPVILKLFGIKQKRQLLLVTVISACLFQLIFFELLGIYLPKSELSYWLLQE